MHADPRSAVQERADLRQREPREAKQTAIGNEERHPPSPEPAVERAAEAGPRLLGAAESLAEGIVSGHPEMPIFVFDAHQVDAIIAYLESIQQDEPAEEKVPGSGE